ncbi:galanin peptides isoform X3 [Hoplias malabaricus]|uniref:galanin peptides isoform X3 n=1 Tax=Hoplias malabaricus TaxID=27720 RepID=UPI00346270CD
MQKCLGGVCVSLILCAVLSETVGMVIAAKEKRGWTLNSAGYLLGPQIREEKNRVVYAPVPVLRDASDAIDSHRTLSDKHGLAGKRDMEDDFKSGAQRITDEDIVHTIIDFLSYLKLKEMGALENLPSSLTSEELSQP